MWLERVMHHLMTLTYWHWLAISALFLIIELLVSSGGFLLWLAICALLIGIVIYIYPDIALAYQLLVFSISGIVASIWWWNYAQRRAVVPVLEKPFQVQVPPAAESYVGKVFTLEKPMVKSKGTLQIDGATWHLSGPPKLESGTRVQVISTIGSVLLVEKYSDPVKRGK